MADRWRAKCRRRVGTVHCPWTTTGSREWCDKAAVKHRDEHRDEDARRERARQQRYQWKGRPNPTQVRLLEAVSRGAVRAHRTTIHAHTTYDAWYAELPGRELLWWPALLEAGLVRARATFGDRDGVWLLTDAGRKTLADAPALPLVDRAASSAR